MLTKSMIPCEQLIAIQNMNQQVHAANAHNGSFYHFINGITFTTNVSMSLKILSLYTSVLRKLLLTTEVKLELKIMYFLLKVVYDMRHHIL